MAVDLSGYRIVDAALDADDTAEVVSVSVDHIRETLVVTVSGVPGATRGIVAARIRARAAALGGKIRFDPAGVVQVHLPAPPEAAGPDDHGGGGGIDIRVMVVDDQPVVRAGFAAILDAEPDLTVVGTAADGAAALDLAARTDPDVVLMDIRMPGMDGLTATARLTASGLPSKVLVLTTFDLDEYVYQALRAGASGYLLKDADPADLIAAVRAVAAGDGTLAPAGAAPADRGVRDRPGGAGGGATGGRARGPDSPRGAGADAGGPWTVEHGDRGGAEHRHRHGEDVHQRAVRKARRARPGAGDDPGLRPRPGAATLVSPVS